MTDVFIRETFSLEDRPAWQRRAACRGLPPKLFYPARGATIGRDAQKICHGCPVREECLDYALQNREFGVWGGLSERRRRAIKKLGVRTARAYLHGGDYE